MKVALHNLQISTNMGGQCYFWRYRPRYLPDEYWYKHNTLERVLPFYCIMHGRSKFYFRGGFGAKGGGCLPVSNWQLSEYPELVELELSRSQSQAVAVSPVAGIYPVASVIALKRQLAVIIISYNWVWATSNYILPQEPPPLILNTPRNNTF